MRQVVLDTETTGLEPEAGHRIIEIGCVELINRRPTQQSFHCYINPERSVDLGALEVHGIDDEFLATQPRFDEVAEAFVDFVAGAELVIHNAEFDIAFINHELRRLDGDTADITRRCQVLDTLALARRLHPGQRNSLDALAKRYQVDNSGRDLHGALLDARILAEVYLAMTGGQASLSLDGDAERARPGALKVEPVDRDGLTLVVPGPSDDELAAHRAMLDSLAAQRGSPTLWQRSAADEPQ